MSKRAGGGEAERRAAARRRTDPDYERDRGLAVSRGVAVLEIRAAGDGVDLGVPEYAARVIEVRSRREALRAGSRPHAPRRPSDEVAAERLVRSQAEYVRRSRQAREALVVRDRYVDRLRTLGWSWDRIAAVLGVSRQALTKRSG